jgi:hypothetical protein
MGLSSYTINQRKIMRSVQELRNYLGAVMKRIDSFDDRRGKFVKAVTKDVQKRTDVWFIGRKKTLQGIEKRITVLEKEVHKWR